VAATSDKVCRTTLSFHIPSPMKGPTRAAVRGHMRTHLFLLLTLSALPLLAAAPVADDRATKDDYAFDTTGTATTLKKGSSGPFSLVITPKNGKKVHPDAPLEIAFIENAAVKPAKQKLGRGDLKEKGALAPHAVTTLQATKAGATTLQVTVSFFLCTDAWCQRMTDRVELPILVEE
jgi:hypothetical protein